MDLIRALLLDTEGEEKPDLSRWTEQQQVYHMGLLIEAGLVHGQIMEDSNGDIASTVTTRVTWDGHEFLDSARDDTVWRKVKEKLSVVGSNVALPILTAMLTDLTKKKLGIP